MFLEVQMCHLSSLDYLLFILVNIFLNYCIFKDFFFISEVLFPQKNSRCFGSERFNHTASNVYLFLRQCHCIDELYYGTRVSIKESGICCNNVILKNNTNFRGGFTGGALVFPLELINFSSLHKKILLCHFLRSIGVIFIQNALHDTTHIS